MATLSEIEALGRQIGEEHGAERVILFGSHARGTAGPNADVDLLVVVPFEGSRARQAAEIRMGLRPGFPLDLLVRTPEEIVQRVRLGDPFVTEVLREGRTVYGATESRVG